MSNYNLIHYFDTDSILQQAFRFTTEDNLIIAVQISNNPHFFAYRGLYQAFYAMVLRSYNGYDKEQHAWDDFEHGMNQLEPRIWVLLKSSSIINQPFWEEFEVFKCFIRTYLFQESTSKPANIDMNRYKRIMHGFLEIAKSNLNSQPNQNNNMELCYTEIKRLKHIFIYFKKRSENIQAEDLYMSSFKQWLQYLLLCLAKADHAHGNSAGYKDIIDDLLILTTDLAKETVDLETYLKPIQEWLKRGIEANHLKSFTKKNGQWSMWSFTPPEYNIELEQLKIWGELTLIESITRTNAAEVVSSYLSAYQQVHTKVQLWQQDWFEIRKMIEEKELREKYRYIPRLIDLDNALSDIAIRKLKDIEQHWFNVTERYLHQDVIKRVNVILKELHSDLYSRLNWARWLSHSCYAYTTTEGLVLFETQKRVISNQGEGNKSIKMTTSVETYCQTYFTMSDLAAELLPRIVDEIENTVLVRINQCQDPLLRPIVEYCTSRIQNLCAEATRSVVFWKKSQFNGTRREITSEISYPVPFTAEDADNIGIPLPAFSDTPPPPTETLGVDVFLSLHARYINLGTDELGKNLGYHIRTDMLYSGHPDDTMAMAAFKESRKLVHSTLALRRLTAVQGENYASTISLEKYLEMLNQRKEWLREHLCKILLDKTNRPILLDDETFRLRIVMMVEQAPGGIHDAKITTLEIINQDERLTPFRNRDLSFLIPLQPGRMLTCARSVDNTIDSLIGGMTFFSSPEFDLSRRPPVSIFTLCYNKHPNN